MYIIIELDCDYVLCALWASELFERQRTSFCITTCSRSIKCW